MDGGVVDGMDEVRLRDGPHARLSADTICRRNFGVVGETETQLQDLGMRRSA